MTKEALKLALEALESSRVFVTTREKIKHPEGAEWYDQIITAIKEALANEALEKMAENARELGLDYEPPQEPVAWAKFSAKGNIIDPLSEPDDDYTPLYTTPPQRKPLSDEEIETYRHMLDWTAEWSYINFARAIEAAHGIKENT